MSWLRAQAVTNFAVISPEPDGENRYGFSLFYIYLPVY